MKARLVLGLALVLSGVSAFFVTGANNYSFMLDTCESIWVFYGVAFAISLVDPMRRWPRICKYVAWAAATLGLALVTCPFWLAVLHPLLFNAKGDYRTNGVSSILPLLDTALGDGWPFLIFFLGLAALIFIYCRDSVRFRALSSRPLTTATFAVILTTYALNLAVLAPEFFLPPGAPIRPMAQAAFLCLLTSYAFAVVAPASIMAAINEKPRFPGIIALIGGFTLLPFSGFLFRLIPKIMGLNMED